MFITVHSGINLIVMCETTDILRDVTNVYREERKERREERIPEILSLRELGYEVKDLNQGLCFRVNGEYDLYPTRNRWHHLKSGARGGTGSLKDFVLERLPLERKGDEAQLANGNQ